MRYPACAQGYKMSKSPSKKCSHVFVRVREEVGGGRCAYDEPLSRYVEKCEKCGAYLLGDDDAKA